MVWVRLYISRLPSRELSAPFIKNGHPSNKWVNHPLKKKLSTCRFNQKYSPFDAQVGTLQVLEMRSPPFLVVHPMFACNVVICYHVDVE